MRWPRVRFSIRSMMFTLVLVAGLLALPKGWGVIVMALSLPCLATIGAMWLVFRNLQYPAAL
jgi:hypothetical protein